jgi:xanthine/CO dehydrogenase XdhC/CoxF family maturation factor
VKHWQETREIFSRAAELLAVGGRCAIGTVVAISGSAYRRPGAKMLTDAQGRTWGGVSGGCLEADVREVALRVMEDGGAVTRRYETGADEDVVWGLGLGCDGSVEILVQPLARTNEATGSFMRGTLDRLSGDDPFAIVTALEGPGVAAGAAVLVPAEGPDPGPADTPSGRLARLAGPALDGVSRVVEDGELRAFVDVFRPPPRVLLCGAGDDAIPLTAAASSAGFRVAVADHRDAYLTAHRFPAAELLDPGQLPGSRLRDAYGVVMTHNLERDRAWVRRLVEGGAAYIGLLGPRARREDILADLDEAERNAVYGPVGLDIGADGPEQVAVSVVAEMLAVLAGRAPRHLRDRERPIHERASADRPRAGSAVR